MPRWSDDRARSPRTRAGMLGAAAVLVAMAVFGVVVVSQSGGGTAAAAHPTATQFASSPKPTSPSAGESTPVASAVDQTIPRVGPPVRWVVFKTLALPVSATAGPRVSTPTVMSGYERSPTGALLAVADNEGRYSIADDWRSATLAAVADTPGRAAFIAQRAPYGRAGDPTPGQLTQVAGFNIVSYTPDRATVQLARAATSDGGLTLTTTVVVWKAGDWKILLPDNGIEPPPASLQSLSGLVPWASS